MSEAFRVAVNSTPGKHIRSAIGGNFVMSAFMAPTMRTSAETVMHAYKDGSTDLLKQAVLSGSNMDLSKLTGGERLCHETVLTCVVRGRGFAQAATEVRQSGCVNV